MTDAALSESLLSSLGKLPPSKQAAVSSRLSWIARARPNQLRPETMKPVWLVQAGRGFGKTRVGAEESWFNCAINDNWRWAVVAPTHNDLRRVCFEGESGLLACTPKEVLLNGSVSDAYNRTLC